MNDIDKRLKRGDIVQDLETGELHELADFQYEFNRYQFKWISGWKYGIKNIKKVESGEILDYVKYLSSERKAEREEKERLKQEKSRIMKLYTEQLENDFNQLGKYEKALSFYADTKNYEDTEYKTSDWLPTLPIDRDHGEKARSALGGDRD